MGSRTQTCYCFQNSRTLLKRNSKPTKLFQFFNLNALGDDTILMTVGRCKSIRQLTLTIPKTQDPRPKTQDHLQELSKRGPSCLLSMLSKIIIKPVCDEYCDFDSYNINIANPTKNNKSRWSFFLQKASWALFTYFKMVFGFIGSFIKPSLAAQIS